MKYYRETYLNLTSLGPSFVFGIDRCSVYTGKILTLGIYLKFDLYMISVYSGFCLDRFIQGSV